MERRGRQIARLVDPIGLGWRGGWLGRPGIDWTAVHDLLLFNLQTARKTAQLLLPPNPNELDRATRTSASRATCGT